MTDVRELRKAFDKAVRNAQRRARMAGRLGYQDSSGNWVFDVPGWPNYVYVRLGRDEETTTLHKAVNHAVGLVPDLPVWVERTAEGTLAIVGVRTAEFQVFAGGTRTGATVAPHTHEPGGGMVDPVSERRIKPGLVRAYKSGGAYGLSVYIEPFTFRYNGIEKRWAGGTLNLAAYLPGTANTHRWVKVGVDPNAVTAVAVAGPEKSKLVNLLDSELDAISFQSYIPLAGVKLVYGQTAISSETNFLGCRPWWSGVGSGALATATIDLWDVDQPPAQAEAENDEFSDGSLGGKWAEFDSGAIQTPTESGGALALAQTSQATATLTGAYQTLPAGDFTIAVKLSLDADTPSGDGQAWQAGIALWENAASDTAAAFLAGPAVEQVAGSVRRAIGWSTWAANNNLTLPYWDSQGFAWEASTALYLRLRRTGTEYHLDWGPDGETWYTSTVLVDFTPAQVGIGLYNKASGVTITGSFEFFRRRAQYDALTAPVYGGVDLSAGKLGELGDVDLVTTPPADGQALTYDTATATWGPGDAGGVPLAMWTIAGNQTPVASPLRIYNTSGITRTIAKVFVSVNTPPTGSALIVDVHKNGTTIFTNQANRPQIADGQYTGQSTTIDVIDWAPGDYLTVEVDQVGSTTPGADLTVQVALSDAAGGGGGGSGTDTTAFHTNTANEIAGLTEKASPIAADLLVIEDSAAGNVKKKAQAGNLPFLSSLADHDHSGDAGDGGTFDAANLTSGAATDGQVLTADGLGGAAWEAPVGGEDPNAIHDNVSGEINAVTEKATPVSADLVLIEDSAASYAKKKVQVGNLPGGGGGSSITIYAEVVLFDVTLGADGNFDFQNIPQDYDHLKVYFFGQRSSTAGSGGVYLNNDTTETNYRTSLHRSGSNHTNALNNNAGLLNTPSISYFDGNIWCKATIEIPNYRATSYKVLYARMVQFDLDAGPVFAWHDYYINSMVHKGGTAAINRLTITQGATGWLAGSRCVVVGVGPLQLLAAT